MTVGCLRPAPPADDLRSVNGQIEYLLAAALRMARRLPGRTSAPDAPRAAGEDGAGASDDA